MPNICKSGGERLIYSTTSLCKICRNAVPAEVLALSTGEVWMHKLCPKHGEQTACLSSNAGWYEQTLSTGTSLKPLLAPTEPKYGCPFDCGLCQNHQQPVRLPIVNITSACNLDCPICFVHNKNQDAFYMSMEEFQQTLHHLLENHRGELDLINFTGGEPTLHPNFDAFIAASNAAGIHRVSLCSNGILLGQNESLVQRIAAANGRVALSFYSFATETERKIQGKSLLETKWRCLDFLEKYHVNTTLIPVILRGYNDHEIGKMIDLLLERPHIRHLEFHLITYTGQGGTSFDRSGRITLYEVLQLIEQQTGGWLTPQDFVSSPCAHPLCYQIAYLLMDQDGGKPVPFTRFLDRRTIYDCFSGRLYLEPEARLQRALQEAIDRLWCEETPEAEHILSLLKRLLSRIFPMGSTISHAEALQISEQAIKAIYIHSHMDAENFDAARVAYCCCADCFADGSIIPVCNYNVLFRDKQPQFNRHPKTWNERHGGRV